VHTRHREACRWLYDRLQAYGDWWEFNGVTTTGPVASRLGLLAVGHGEVEAAEAHLQAAWLRCRAFPAPLLEMEVDYLLALAAEARGDHATARRRLDEVDVLARRHGAHRFDRLASLLRARVT